MFTWRNLSALILAVAMAHAAHANTCAPAAVKGTAPADYQSYCWLDDQPSEAQVNTPGNTIAYAQQSRVSDIDANYQTTKWLSLGVKYAIRTGQLKPTASASGNWYASQAQLWILRSDLLFPRQWDALIELRRLSIRETDDHRLGFLLGGYRHVGDHLKIGAGYNFTNYSDNLTM
jgi:hypothetical protein